MIQYWQKPKLKRNNRIYELHLEGKSDAEIGRKYKISRQMVRKIRLKYAKNQTYAHSPIDK